VTQGAAQRVLLKAHAKVNLFLAVGERRPDGYHDVTTVMQALELADDVTVALGGQGIELTCEPDLGVPPESNLAYRAAAAWFAARGGRPSARLAVRKRVPAGAGLGGGSSDAAAVLVGLAALEPDVAGRVRDLSGLAAGLGADVPFFLGAGTQLLAGRGDLRVESLPTPDLDIVLVNPGPPVETGAAYARFDRLLRGPAPSPDAMVAAIRSGDREAVAHALANNITDASCSLVPEVAGALRFTTASHGVLGAAMAGSGSTVFGVCAGAEAARSCAEAARDLGWWACATRGVPAGVTTADAQADEGVPE